MNTTAQVLFDWLRGVPQKPQVPVLKRIKKVSFTSVFFFSIDAASRIASIQTQIKPENWQALKI